MTAIDWLIVAAAGFIGLIVLCGACVLFMAVRDQGDLK